MTSERPTKAGALIVGALLACAVLGAACAPPPAPVEVPTPPPPPDPEPAERGRVSALWGRSGEAWRPGGRLPDFSRAGYAMGERHLPAPAVVADVRELGAVGDGEADDTGAFERALAEAEDGAVFVPPGRYRITRPLEIRRSNVVLRGAGRDETVLFFPHSLFERLGPGEDGGPTGWSWGGAWIRAAGTFREGPPLAEVTAPSWRGEESVAVSSTERIRPGQWVRLVQEEEGRSLSNHLHAEHTFHGECSIAQPGLRTIDWALRVERVEDGRLYFDRPFRAHVRPLWKARILPFLPTLQEVGVEHLTVEFPPTPKPTHHKDLGYNAIELRWVFNSWVRGVRVVNFDNAVHFWYSRYSTARDILLEGRGGHYGLSMGGSQDSLMTRFDIRNRSFHDLSVAALANGCVFSRGRGVSINFDHHRGAPYENLFSNIHVGESWKNVRLWECSDTPSGHFSAARETFWNIKPWVKKNFLPLWPQMNIVGRVKKKPGYKPEISPYDLWVESLRPQPRDLHAAQLRRRLGKPRPGAARAGDGPGSPAAAAESGE